MAFPPQDKCPDEISGESAVLIGIGSNLPHRGAGMPLELCEAALAELERRGVAILRRSRWYASAPVPASGQPDFVNGVAAVATALDPPDLLAALHDVEAAFGRTRSVVNAARPRPSTSIFSPTAVSSAPAGARRSCRIRA